MRPGRDPDLDGYLVMDADDRTVGPVTSFWLDDETGQPAFASVKAGLRGRHHAVPLRYARLDERGRRLRVPYRREAILDAPAFPDDHVLTPGDERGILAHYHEAPPGHAPGSGARDIDIPLHEERVDVAKKVVRAGAVRLRKVVRTRIVHQPVEVRYEEILVERIPYPDVPPDLEASDRLPSEPFREGEMVLREYAEEPVVTKHTELVSGVRAHRAVEHEQRNIGTHARREDVEVERHAPGPGRPLRGPLDE